jgi:NAD(P)-dependent dehydrogenase (short-subunit alcohol dehydrogenase family)
MGLLDRKTAVITGANSGIGLATAARFIAEGADRFLASDLSSFTTGSTITADGGFNQV